MTKYKIESYRGCTTDCLIINGGNSAEMTQEELANVICSLLHSGYYPDPSYLQSFIEDIAESNGVMEVLYRCDQCGDTATKSTLNADCVE